jgi:hypothetical protein
MKNKALCDEQKKIIPSETINDCLIKYLQLVVYTKGAIRAAREKKMALKWRVADTVDGAWPQSESAGSSHRNMHTHTNRYIRMYSEMVIRVC